MFFFEYYFLSLISGVNYKQTIMTNAQIFEYANSIVLPAWILLAIAPKWKWTTRIVPGIIVALLSALYVSLVFQAISFDEMSNFGSLEGVMALFTKPGAVLVGWIHYLAFDLFVGWFIATDAVKNRIHQLIIAPCLFFTFMLGPTGLLLYLLIRFLFTKKYFFETPTQG